MTETAINRKSAREIKGKKDLHGLLDDVVDVDDDNSIVSFLLAHGYKNVQVIFTLDDETIDNGVWVDKKGRIKDLPFVKGSN